MVENMNYQASGLELATKHRAGDYVVTTTAIAAGTIVVAWGGRVVDRATFSAFDRLQQTHSLQVADDLFLLAPDPPELGDFVNHSCDPTCGVMGSSMLVTMQALLPGDEVTFDYAMTDTDPYDEFACSCGAAACRGLVSADDWRLPELQQRYAGFFSAHVQRRIDQLMVGAPAERIPAAH
jgi:hypothetical protein